MVAQPVDACSVTGTAPLIDQSTGALLVRERKGALQYDLSWWEPRSTTTCPVPHCPLRKLLARLAKSRRGLRTWRVRRLEEGAFVPDSLGFGAVPARQLQRGDGYGTSETGSGWPQLREF
ncbi:hypothetical protein, partial [Kibdelosporangium philippinense]|uniref:hypothetical protein n=1 Tax=Kibdelosporangium philippinense TaxID=211113 RepID=UPI00361AD707